ncbi:MAG: orotate phosphoribosyltransferase [Candidatus Goldiibacteriota bacterium]
MEEEKVLEVFRRANALLVGHFLLTSGKHSNIYLEKFSVLKNPEHTTLLCREIARKFKKYKPDVVLGAAVGGIILAYETARQLKVPGIFMEREKGRLKLRRGFDIKEGEKVLIVEDIVTTGGSVYEVIDELKTNYKCEIAGVGLLVDRSGKEIDFNEGETYALARMDIKTYDEKDCPMCKKGQELTKRGSRNIKK